jgi:HNH endonuclease
MICTANFTRSASRNTPLRFLPGYWPPAETRMIRLTKGPAPDILVRRGEAWSTEYLRRLEAGGVRRDLPAYHRHAAVKTALRVESRDKCMYCESLVSHAQYGDIDHYVPVSVRPDLVVSWVNLGFSCERCNNNKGDYWDARLPLVNPYAEDPSDFLMFAGPIAVQKPGSLRGRVTIERIGLNRDELIARRKERLERCTCRKCHPCWSGGVFVLV